MSNSSRLARGSFTPGASLGRRSGWPQTTIAAWALWAVSLALVALSLATARSGGPEDPGSAIVEGLAVVSLVTTGAFLVSRLPRHRIGWLLLLGGMVLAASGATSGLADYGLAVHPGSVPGATWFAWVSEWTWAPEIACLFVLLPAFYPSGRLVSPRWRAVVGIGASLVLVGGVASALSPWVPDPFPVGNPLAVGGTAGNVMSFLNNVVGTVLVVSGGVLAVASLLVRYRRGSGIERAQLKWFAAVATVTGVAALGSIATNSPSSATGPTGALGTVSAVFNVLIYVGLALLPLAIGIAVLRYRLYEIDRLISRTLAYGLVTLALLAVFGGAILLLSALLSPLTGGNTLAVAGSTVLVAALFQPVRRRVQGLVDRRFNRRRYDAQAAVAAFTERLRDEVDLDTLQGSLLTIVEATLEPTTASLWLRE